MPRIGVKIEEKVDRYINPSKWERIDRNKKLKKIKRINKINNIKSFLITFLNVYQK
jgi:hypothetical protein